MNKMNSRSYGHADDSGDLFQIKPVRILHRGSRARLVLSGRSSPLLLAVGKLVSCLLCVGQKASL